MLFSRHSCVSSTGKMRGQLACPHRTAVSVCPNLRHGLADVRRLHGATCRSQKFDKTLETASLGLPVALAAGACSLLLASPAAQSAFEQPSYAHAAAVVPVAAQHQSANFPAGNSMPAHFPAASAPPVLTLPAQQVQDILQPQHQQMLQIGAANAQQQQGWPQELQQLAQFDEPKTHWLLVVLGIGVVNVLGLQAVLKVLQASKDSSTPVTVLVCRMGLRVDNKDSKLQERLHFLRDMMGVEHAMFFTFEEAMQTLCNPPRGCQLAYADLTAQPLGSKQAGYDMFKQTAMAEVVRAEQEEAGVVVHGAKPDAPHHRNMLEKLLGAAETQDAEMSQACLLVTLVVLSKGTFELPQQAMRDAGRFKETIKSLCGHLKVGQMLAVELLMTPDSSTDFLSEAQLMSDYAFLTDLSSGLRIDHPDWSLAPSPFASTDDYGRNQYVADTAAAAMASMATEGAGAQGAASAAAAAAAMTEEQRA